MLRVALLVCALLASGPTQAQNGGALRARHAALQQQLAASPFGRPLHVESAVNGGTHKGDVHAVLDQPYAAVAAALARPAHWCDVLTLQINIKRCEASDQALAAFVTKKPRDPVSSAHRIEFRLGNVGNVLQAPRDLAKDVDQVAEESDVHHCSTPAIRQ